MKKSFKILTIFLFSLIFFGISKTVEANSIDKISMDIYIDSNGDATLTETWQCSVNEGTEVYHPYYNLGNSKIENLKVSENRTQYQTLSSWNTSGSLSAKAYKCGINKITNGLELCWGINEYGSHTYQVQYTISKFVSKLSDSQMIYWTLIPYDFSNPIGKVDIKIYSDFTIPDTTDVWGYGNYGGLCYVSNGAIYMSSFGRLESREYMTILAKFPTGTFNTTNKLDYDFNHFFEKAEVGTTKYQKDEQKDEQRNISIFKIIMMIIGAIIIFIVSLLIPSAPFLIMLITNLDNKLRGFQFGESGEIIEKDIEYYRDIPCKGDIFRAYYIAYQYGLLKSKTDILGAIILKWLKEGIIRTDQRETGMIFKKENTVIILGSDLQRQFENQFESELFEMMHIASKDGILENREFDKWCSKSYSRILDWFDEIIRNQRKKLVEEGLIETQDSFFGKTYTATFELKNEALQIAGLKKFLLEYTLIKDRYAIEVQMFENYLIYAQMMGIAKQVSKQFKELYPNIIEQSNFSSYDNIVYITDCASNGISSANSAKSYKESNRDADNYSSGGGGYSSGGGGDDSFGGGGGRRRFSLKFKC